MSSDDEAEETCITDLPADVLGHVIRDLPLPSALQITATSSFFNTTIKAHYLPRVKAISLKGKGGAQAINAMRWICTSDALGDLEDLTIEGAAAHECTELLLSSQRHLPTLQQLALLEYKKLDGLRLRVLIERIPALRSLEIENCQVGDEGLLAIVTHCPQLQNLSAAHCRRMTDDGVLRLAMGCTSLRSVNFEGCVALTQKSLAFLSFYCPSLNKVSVAKCFKMSPAAANGLIDPVYILGSAYSSRTTPMVIPMSHLSLSMCHRVNNIDCLAKLSTLTSLDITGCGSINDTSLLKALSGSTKGVRYLNLGGCTGLTGGGICEILEQSPSVNTLLMRGVGLKDADLRGMAIYLKRISEIDLSMSSQVTDLGLEALIKAVENLEVLKMDGVFHATNRVLRLLRRHARRSLRVLSVRMCNNLTYDGLCGLILGRAGMRYDEPEFELRGWDDEEDVDVGCCCLQLLVVGGSIEESEMMMMASKIKFMTMAQGRDVTVRW